MMCNACMDISDVRRRALRRLIETKCGGVSRQLALACNKPERQINDMLSSPPRKSFGEKVARGMEAALGLPPLYFDQESNTQGSAPAPVAMPVAMPDAAYPAESLQAYSPPTVAQEARLYGLEPEERELLDGYRLADASLKRTMLLLAGDALRRFGRRKANHQ
mgnify:FL=1